MTRNRRGFIALVIRVRTAPASIPMLSSTPGAPEMVVTNPTTWQQMPAAFRESLQRAFMDDRNCAQEGRHLKQTAPTADESEGLVDRLHGFNSASLQQILAPGSRSSRARRISTGATPTRASTAPWMA